MCTNTYHPLQRRDVLAAQSRIQLFQANFRPFNATVLAGEVEGMHATFF